MRTSLIVDPSGGRLPPLTAAAEQRTADRIAARERMGGRWGAAEANELDDRCIIMRGAGPPMLSSGYNSNYHIVQAPGYVMILVEMIHDARVIPLDGRGRDQPPSQVRQWMGMSTGRWEGETLVVETTNLNGKNPIPSATGRIIPGSGDQMRVTERFTRVLRIGSSTNSGSTTWGHGPHPGPQRCRCGGRRVRSSSTPATRGTTGCTTRSLVPGGRSKRLLRRPRPRDRVPDRGAPVPLDVGARLGPYRVTAKIGEGGMGEVYRATDTKLDRDVALKVLPQAFTDDPDRLARFEREAKVLASLNHPNIGHIYGLEEAEGQKALVLELVEGPTLAERIKQGPIPVDEALPIAKQIAEALEAAHE